MFTFLLVVNFGLETKRSVIHPRCDSSNRSARLSVSSEKLFPLPPGHRGACPHPGENTMDDDIEKRVLVNKDGSLSMEMKVRFRLLHNETLHWTTEVKKSKSTLMNPILYLMMLVPSRMAVQRAAQKQILSLLAKQRRHTAPNVTRDTLRSHIASTAVLNVRNMISGRILYLLIKDL